MRQDLSWAFGAFTGRTPAFSPNGPWSSPPPDRITPTRTDRLTECSHAIEVWPIGDVSRTVPKRGFRVGLSPLGWQSTGRG